MTSFGVSAGLLHALSEATLTANAPKRRAANLTRSTCSILHPNTFDLKPCYAAPFRRPGLTAQHGVSVSFGALLVILPASVRCIGGKPAMGDEEALLRGIVGRSQARLPRNFDWPALAGDSLRRSTPACKASTIPRVIRVPGNGAPEGDRMSIETYGIWMLKLRNNRKSASSISLHSRSPNFLSPSSLST